MLVFITSPPRHRTCYSALTALFKYCDLHIIFTSSIKTTHEDPDLHRHVPGKGSDEVVSLGHVCYPWLIRSPTFITFPMIQLKLHVACSPSHPLSWRCAAPTVINGDEWGERLSLFSSSLNRKFPLSLTMYSLYQTDRVQPSRTPLPFPSHPTAPHRPAPEHTGGTKGSF